MKKAQLETETMENLEKRELLKKQVDMHDGKPESFYLFWTKYVKHILNRHDIDDTEKQIILCQRLFEKDQNKVVNSNLAATQTYLFKKYRSPKDIQTYIYGTFSNYQMEHRRDIDGLEKLTETLQSAIPLAKNADPDAHKLLEWLFKVVYNRIAEELQLQFWNDYPDRKNCPENLFAFLEKQQENLKADRDARMLDDEWKIPNRDDSSKKQSKSKKERRQMVESNSIMELNKMDQVILLFTDLQTKNSFINSQVSAEILFSDKWNIAADKLTINEDEQLGVGSFGKVYKGTLTKEFESIAVAVKKRRPSVTNNEQMLKEAGTMIHFDHPNVLKMHGICKFKKDTEDSHDVHLVMEIMTENLHNYLKHNLVYNTKLIIEQILDGLIYIEGKKYIHRDIASRNILVKDSLVKISDFGLARKLADDGTYTKNEHSKTLRNYYMAPETFESQKSTVKSDVWSLGFVLWEIIAGGKVPFKSLIAELEKEHSTTEERMAAFFKKLKSGTRLCCPKHFKICAIEKCLVYRIITDCWNFEPTSRPSYESIKIKFSPIM